MKRISEKEIIDRIKRLCVENNYEFIGFCDKEGNITNKWIDTNKTRLLIKCNNCNNVWNVFYKSLIYGNIRCPKCFVNSRKCQEDESLKKIQEICNNSDYTFLGYQNRKWVGNETKLKIQCNKCQCVWFPTFHNFKSLKSKCLGCNEYQLETDIKNILEKNDISFNRQKRFKWLGRLSLDFYLPQYNIAIECQGVQHFEPRDFSGRNKELSIINFQKQQERDKRKFLLCQENNIQILYYSNIVLKKEYFQEIMSISQIITLINQKKEGLNKSSF